MYNINLKDRQYNHKYLSQKPNMCRRSGFSESKYTFQSSYGSTEIMPNSHSAGPTDKRFNLELMQG
jgi:hypothetical protein